MFRTRLSPAFCASIRLEPFRKILYFVVLGVESNPVKVGKKLILLSISSCGNRDTA